MHMGTHLHILSDSMDKKVRKLQAPLSVEAEPRGKGGEQNELILEF